MTTFATTPRLPDGAMEADEFVDGFLQPDPNGEDRCVRGPEHRTANGAYVYAACWQRQDGTIVDRADSAPSVVVGVGDQSTDLSPNEAVEFSAAMLDAAHLARKWRWAAVTR